MSPEQDEICQTSFPTINFTGTVDKQKVGRKVRVTLVATYEYGKCGMAVNTTCAKCDVPLIDASLEIGDGKIVQGAKHPKCEGEIKSPSCCGEEIACGA